MIDDHQHPLIIGHPSWDDLPLPSDDTAADIPITDDEIEEYWRLRDKGDNDG